MLPPHAAAQLLRMKCLPCTAPGVFARATNPPRRQGAWQAAAMVLCWVTAAQIASTAQAQSTPATDPVLELLQERGLLPSTAATNPHALVQQVRDAASEAVLAAMNFLGVPYRRGGNTADQGFDCSGFTRFIFEHSLGLLLPRLADQKAHEAGLLAVAREQLKPGDLVFFNTLRRAFSHVGIYIGDGRFIHSPRVGGAVRIEDMRQAYWEQRFDGARRAAAAP